MIRAKPFLKWAGGKSQLISEIQAVVLRKFDRDRSFVYIEPFIGGGAFLFYILNHFSNLEKAIINDINSDLVQSYCTIKEEHEALINSLAIIEQEYYNLHTDTQKKNFYLKKRVEFNQTNVTDRIVKTTLLIFLNRTCFNGLYRVNQKGVFNVPFGKHKKPKICDRDNICAVHQCLKNVDILQGDFAKTLDFAGKNTLFYLDPPYKPLNPTSAFTAYSKENFGDRDQLRLKDFCDRVSQKGGHFLLSNSDVQNGDRDRSFFDDLYDADYTIKRVKAKRNINSKGDSRGEISEVLISNF
ncbi:MAG: Dam family site-specific DNA-(adenine-N6)-methyltransferase [Cyanobacteria bacterium SBLK]|nr:Dam family site-specific DNA-(adenine-N6)-methyltransferase [Cyanobacteria bacterium SBLK]